jgi:hypothetical protein
VLTAALSLIPLPESRADNQPTMCYVAEDGKAMPVDLVLLATMQKRHPKIEYGADDSPVKLVWESMPENVTATSEIIGRFQGRDIYRIIYKHLADDQDELDFGVLALARHAHTIRSPVELRPFFLIPCDQVQWLEALPVSYPDCPFGIEVEETFDGKSIHIIRWLLQLTDAGARMIERTEREPGMEGKTERFK